MHGPPRTSLPAPVGPEGSCLLQQGFVPTAVWLIWTQSPLCPGSSGFPSRPPWASASSGRPVSYHGRAVVIVFMIWFPGLETAPAEPMVAFGTGHATEEAAGQRALAGQDHIRNAKGLDTPLKMPSPSLPITSLTSPIPTECIVLLSSPIQYRLNPLYTVDLTSGRGTLRSRNTAGCQERAG